MSQRGSVGVNATSHSSSENSSAAAEQSLSGSAPSGAGSYGDSPRKPKAERDNTFDAGVWLLQGLAGLSEELRHSDLGLPEEFWVHAYAARKEALLAAKALVDAALEHCAAEENRADTGAKAKKKPPQRGQVSIDFG